MNIDQQTKVAIITIATPILIAVAKAAVPRIPKWMLPILAPIVGGILDGLAASAGMQDSSPMLSIVAGAAGVGLREVVDQMRGQSKSGPPVSVIIAALVASQFVLGCASYTNTRSIDPKTSVVTETTKVRAPFLTKSTIEGLKAHVSDRVDKNGTHSYSKSIGLTNATSETDVEGIKALQTLLGSALVEALKKAP